MILYFSSASPYVRKVMVAAHELGLADRIHIAAETVTPIAPNEAYAKKHPLMKVPALECDDGEMLYDSVVICEYLDDLAGEHRLFPVESPARWRNLRLHALGDGILDAALLLRYETAFRPEQLRWSAWTSGQQRKIDHALDQLEGSVHELEPFAIGAICVACALGYLDFRFSSMEWRIGRPRLAAWFQHVEEHPSLSVTRPG